MTAVDIFHIGCMYGSLRFVHVNLTSALCSILCGVMGSVLASSAVDRGFELRSDKTKDYKIDFCCFSAKHTTLR